MQTPHLFNQNNKVDKYNGKVHHLATGVKYTIKAHDSVVGAHSAELRGKIMKQIPNDPRKTRQIISNLKLAEVELKNRIGCECKNSRWNDQWCWQHC